uniref:hypothetical protein n=1 Tax=Nocardia suismassiliense TaxID=2077092 RepID=UPI003F4949C6
MVLRAVLKLLCGWSRIHDDRVRIHQIIELCGPEHRYDPKTVGRTLAALRRGEFIDYTPALGRGRFATVAIHPRFLHGITELERDEDGRVVVTFSRRRPYISQRNHLPTPRSSRTSVGGRPREVKVDANEVRRVLASAPAIYRGMPRHLRWCLGREIRTHLARGFTARQLLDILAAPMPEQVERPLRLAKWRFSHNLIGAGPRLAPLQRAWDEQQRTAEHARYAADQRRRAVFVFAGTTAPIRHRMLAALRAKFSAPIVDETTALVHAARMATRDNPGLPLTEAIHRWLDTQLPAAPATAETRPAVAPEPDTGVCVACGADGGSVREELPLRSLVCDCCWTSATTAA